MRRWLCHWWWCSFPPPPCADFGRGSVPSCALVSPSLQEKVGVPELPWKRNPYSFCGQQTQDRVCVGNACACSGERVQFVANIALPSLFFIYYFFDADWCPSQSLGSWAAGQLGAHLWQVACGRTRLESLLSLSVVPEWREGWGKAVFSLCKSSWQKGLPNRFVRLGRCKCCQSLIPPCGLTPATQAAGTPPSAGGFLPPPCIGPGSLGTFNQGPAPSGRFCLHYSFLMLLKKLDPLAFFGTTCMFPGIHKRSGFTSYFFFKLQLYLRILEIFWATRLCGREKSLDSGSGSRVQVLALLGLAL